MSAEPLHAELKDTTFVYIPTEIIGALSDEEQAGFHKMKRPVVRLKKALYGHPNAGFACELESIFVRGRFEGREDAERSDSDFRGRFPLGRSE